MHVVWHIRRSSKQSLSLSLSLSLSEIKLLVSQCRSRSLTSLASIHWHLLMRTGTEISVSNCHPTQGQCGRCMREESCSVILYVSARWGIVLAKREYQCQSIFECVPEIMGPNRWRAMVTFAKRSNATH